MIASRLEGMVELQSQGTAPTASPGTTTNGAPMGHDEFPPLTPAASAVLDAGNPGRLHETWKSDRRHAAAVIRETVRQAKEAPSPGYTPSHVFEKDLLAIADNLHALPPSPPTREEMESALRGMQSEFVTNLDFGRYAKVLHLGIVHYCKE